MVRGSLRLHEAAWRREISGEQARRLRDAFAGLPLERDDPPELGGEAWAVADELGWAKTYDAEYVALARLRGCLLVTTDLRLRRGADRLGCVVAQLNSENVCESPLVGSCLVGFRS